MRKVLFVVAMFALSACASGGVKTLGTVIDPQAADRLVVGQTTIDEVKAAFGDPDSEKQFMGKTMLTYRSSKELKDRALPMMGLHKDQSLYGDEIVSFIFSADGKLTKKPEFQRNGVSYKKIHQAADAK